MNMLRARAAPRMPPDRPLSEVDIRLIEAWILNGAKKSVSGNASDGGMRDATTNVDAADERPVGQDGPPALDSGQDTSQDTGQDAGQDIGQDAGVGDRGDTGVADTMGGPSQ
ncbi:MAG: hypothetical protein H7X95_08090 [Deltaproteobacteria bacterium]|nr:hypothetical protein [Deltaproteobacteria bacterium]